MKRFPVIILLYSFITYVPSSTAGGLDGVLDGMFANVTAPQFSKDQYRGTVSFGGVYVRSPVTSIQVASFDPPRVSVGCGGIDIYGGSFSFITADMLSQFIRNIAQNAAPLAFKLALDAVSPQLGAALNKFQDMAQKMNMAQKNSCEISQGMFDAAKTGGLSGVMENLNTLKTGALATAEGWGNDFAEGMRLAVSQQDPSTPSNGKSFKEVLAKNKDTGNVVWNALVLRESPTPTNSTPIVTGIADNAQLAKELIISLVGTSLSTEITGASYRDQSISLKRTAQADIPTPKWVPVEPTLNTIDDLLNPKLNSTATGVGGQNTYSVTVLTCIGPTKSTTCLEMEPKVTNLPGVRGYIIKRMLGDETYETTHDADSNSIIGRLQCDTTCSGYGITPQQQKFLNQLGRIPAVSLLSRASRNGGRHLKLVQTFVIDAMTRQVSISYIDIVLSTLSSAYSNTVIPKPTKFDDVVKDLKRALAELKKADESYATKALELVTLMDVGDKQSLPLARLNLR